MRKKIFAVAGLGLASALAVGGTAFADPSGSGNQTGPFSLAGVGSDTVQDVFNQFATDIDATNANRFASYNAFGVGGNTLPSNLKASGCTSLPRPNGSGSGRKALVSSLTNTSTTVTQPDGTTSASTNYNGCIDFSRSSSLDTTTSDGGVALTYVPFADDAVSFAVTRTSGVPRTLSITDLQHIYTCDPAYVGSGTNNYTGSGPGNNPSGWSIIPTLPQAGSGTRSYWEKVMNITDANVVAGTYPCIANGAYTRGGTVHAIEEHTSDFLLDTWIAPFSIPNFLNQTVGLVADRRGNGVLGTVASGGDLAVSNGGTGAPYTGLTEALSPPTSFNFQRHVYSVVPRHFIDSTFAAYVGSTNATAQLYAAVFGAGGSICSDSTALAKYHFLPVASDRTCGAITDHTTGTG